MIEVNEYVRTNSGLIFKVNEITYDEEYKDYLYKESFLLVDWKENIVKHSKQLIDLIEVGDIVNGHLVTNIIDYQAEKNIKILETEYIPVTYEKMETGKRNYIYATEAETILTKEQMEANCYKVGGE